MKDTDLSNLKKFFLKKPRGKEEEKLLGGILYRIEKLINKVSICTTCEGNGECTECYGTGQCPDCEGEGHWVTQND